MPWLRAFPQISNRIAQVLVQSKQLPEQTWAGETYLRLSAWLAVHATRSRCAATLAGIACGVLAEDSCQIETLPLPQPFGAAGRRLSLDAQVEWRLPAMGCVCRRTGAGTACRESRQPEDVAEKLQARLPRRVGLWINKKAQIKFENVARAIHSGLDARGSRKGDASSSRSRS